MPFDKHQFIDPDEFGRIKSEYFKKNDLLNQVAKSVTPTEFYQDLFYDKLEPHGIDCSKSTGIANVILVYSPKQNKENQFPDGKVTKLRSTIITEDERSRIETEFFLNPCCMIPSCTFYGRTAKAKNARYIYSITIDLDYVYSENLDNLINQAVNDLLPAPTYIVNSGTGLHLYYMLIEALPAYPETRRRLTKFKRALTKVVWNKYTSHIPITEYDKTSGKLRDLRQYHGITQAYRTIGSASKLGGGFPVLAYKYGPKWDLQDLNHFLDADDQKDSSYDPDVCHYKSELSLEEAKKKYPDWYERRIVKKEPRKTWSVNKGLYDWFFNKISSEARYGHRYYCIGMLAIYAIKCGVSKETVMADALSLYDYLNALSPGNPITKDEIIKAVNGYYKKEFITFPKNSIEHLSQISIPTRKRNGLKQSDHLKIITAIRQAKQKLGMVKMGPPEKSQLVHDWIKNHPGGTKAECLRDTHLSRTTIRKWWPRAD